MFNHAIQKDRGINNEQNGTIGEENIKAGDMVLQCDCE